MFGDWKPFPADDRSWELCRRRRALATKRPVEAGTVGVTKRHRRVRPYRYNTVDALWEHRSILGDISGAMRAAKQDA